MERDPFASLKPGNVKLDTRLRRGELTPEEITRLLHSVASSNVAYRGLSGSDRQMLYRVALATGFRAAELAALTCDSFDLDPAAPVAILAAEHTKNRKDVVQPIPMELARDFATGCLPGERWPKCGREPGSIVPPI